jgi:hypothetical protein
MSEGILEYDLHDSHVWCSAALQVRRNLSLRGYKSTATRFLMRQANLLKNVKGRTRKVYHSDLEQYFGRFFIHSALSRADKPQSHLVRGTDVTSGLGSDAG